MSEDLNEYLMLSNKPVTYYAVYCSEIKVCGEYRCSTPYIDELGPLP
jgi:hypothetical protein